MYPWIDVTINFIGGKCPNNCDYCYVPNIRYDIVKKKYSGKLRLINKVFLKPLGSGKTIFVGSCNDMFAKEIPSEWINKVLDRCKEHPNNTYLFQSKNPARFQEFINDFPRNTILGTTIETDRYYPSKAPSTKKRIEEMIKLRSLFPKIMISIEPIMNFNLMKLVNSIREINPLFVSIGADSKKHSLIEPSSEKVDALIKKLKEFTKVKLKTNLKRLR